MIWRISADACRTPRQIVQNDLASATGLRDPNVAEAIGCTAVAGKFAAKRSARSSVARWTCQSARDQLMRQRLGRKQMAAGPAGGQQDRALGHYSAGTARGGTRVNPICVRFSGRLRVSASTMPIEMAIAICDEPP